MYYIAMIVFVGWGYHSSLVPTEFASLDECRAAAAATGFPEMPPPISEAGKINANLPTRGWRCVHS